MAGWFPLSRDALSDPVVGLHPTHKLTQFEAWAWLKAEAAYKDREVANKGEFMFLSRGQLLGARAYLAKKWRWTDNEVRGFLDRLEKHGLIERDHQRRDNQVQIITICNYDENESSANRAARGQFTSKPPANHQHGTSEKPASHHSKKKGNKGNNGKMEEADLSRAAPDLTPNWYQGKEAGCLQALGDWWEPVLARYARDGAWPVDILGPEPWDEGCLVPEALISKLSLRVKYPKPAAAAQPGGNRGELIHGGQARIREASRHAAGR